MEQSTRYAKQRRWADAHPEKVAEIQGRYAHAHRDEINAKARAYHGANKEKANAAHRAWAKADPWRKARLARDTARSRARIAGLDPGTLTKEDFARLHLLPCAYCGIVPSGGADHVIELSQGGPNTLDNLVPACLPCNMRKRSSLTDDQVGAIRVRRTAGAKIAPLAREYGVSVGTIEKIVRVDRAVVR